MQLSAVKCAVVAGENRRKTFNAADESRIPIRLALSTFPVIADLLTFFDRQTKEHRLAIPVPIRPVGPAD